MPLDLAKLQADVAEAVARITELEHTMTYNPSAGTVPVSKIAASGTAQTLTAAASGNSAYDITLTGNCVLTLAGGTVGQQQTITLYLRQDGTAGRVPSLPSGVKWSTGVVPTPNSAAGVIDVFRFTTPDGGATWLGSDTPSTVSAPVVAAVPNAPTLTVTASAGQNSLAWMDNANGAAIGSHKLYHGASATSLTLLGTITTGTPYLDTGLTNGTAVFYQLSAVNTAGTEGPRSSVVSGTPVATVTVTVPSAGTLATPVAGDGIVTHTLTDGSNGGAAITRHTIYAAATQAGVATATGAALTVGAGGVFTRTVANGVTEWVQVTATNSAGEGARSNFAWGEPQAGSVSPAVGPDLTVGSTGAAFVAGVFSGTQALTSGSGTAAVPISGTDFACGIWFQCPAPTGNSYPLDFEVYGDAGMSTDRTGLTVNPGGTLAFNVGGSYGPIGPQVCDGVAHFISYAIFTAHNAAILYVDGAIVYQTTLSSMPTGTLYAILAVASTVNPTQVYDAVIYNGAGPMTYAASNGPNFTPPTGPLPTTTPNLAALWHLNGNLLSAGGGTATAPTSGVASVGSGTAPGSPTLTLTTGAPTGQAVAGQAFTAPASYTGGAPTAIDYSGDNGSTWALATGLAVGSGLTFSYSGLSGGAGFPAALKIRDHNNPATVSALSPTFTVFAQPLPATDGLPAGIYFPDTVYFAPTHNNYLTIASGFVRGMVAPYTVTYTGLPSGTNDAGGATRIALANGGGTAGTYACSISVTDGTTTLTKTFSVVCKTDCAEVQGNVVFDTSGSGYTSGSARVASFQPENANGAVTITDSTGLLAQDLYGGAIVVASQSNVQTHFGGPHTATLGFTANDGTTVAQPVQVFCGHEYPALSKVTLANGGAIYNSLPVGSVFATVAVQSDLGVLNVTQISGPDLFNIALDPSGTFALVKVKTALAVGSGKALVLSINSNSGKATQITVDYAVGTGTVLPASNMTLTIPTTLDNATPLQVVGTPVVTGITGTPAWSFTNQDITPGLIYGGPTSMFLMNPATGALSFAGLAAARAAGHTVNITCSDGRNVCTQSFVVPVAWKIGPTIHIGQGMSTGAPAGTAGYEYFSHIMSALINNGQGLPTQYLGATLVFHANADPNYFANDCGNGGSPTASPSQDSTTRYGLSGPLRFVSSNPNGPRVRVGGYVGSPSGGTDASGKGFFSCGNGDFYFNGFEVSWCNGYGAPDSDTSHGVSGIRKDADVLGDFWAENCEFHDCNNGIETGEGPIMITINNCVAYNNGGQTVSTGQTHAFYVGGSYLVFHDNLSYNNNIGHCLKTRCIGGHIYNNRLYDGETGSASQQLNIPQGGNYLVEGNDFHKGPNPQNPYCLGYGEDGDGTLGDAGQLTRTSTLTLNNNRFFVGGVAGVRSGVPTGIVHWQCVSGVDGSHSQVLANGNSFYLGSVPGAIKFEARNLDPANTNTWTETGSVALTTAFALDFSDRGTAVPVAAAPGFYNFLFYYGDDIQNMYGVQVKSSVLDIRTPAASAAGTALATLTASGANLYKNDNVANDIRLDPFVAGTTWQITQASEYFGSNWATVGKYAVVANSNGTAATLEVGSVALAAGYDVVKVRATAPNGTLVDWRLSIVVA